MIAHARTQEEYTADEHDQGHRDREPQRQPRGVDSSQDVQMQRRNGVEERQSRGNERLYDLRTKKFRIGYHVSKMI